MLDTQFVDTDGRWLVLHPVFIEILKDEDSRLMDADFGGDQTALKNGLTVGKIHGFDVYMSNNLPAKGTGPGTSGTSNQDNHWCYGCWAFFSYSFSFTNYENRVIS